MEFKNIHSHHDDIPLKHYIHERTFHHSNSKQTFVYLTAFIFLHRVRVSVPQAGNGHPCLPTSKYGKVQELFNLQI